MDEIDPFFRVLKTKDIATHAAEGARAWLRHDNSLDTQRPEYPLHICLEGPVRIA